MWSPLDEWFGDNPLYRRAARVPWWRRGSEVVVPVLAVALLYVGLALDVVFG